MMRRHHLVVTAAESDHRLDRVLAARLPEHSRSFIQKLIRGGQVTISRKPAKAGRPLSEGETIEVCVPDAEPSRILAEPIPLAILYEDDQILVLDKPSGLVVHPGAGARSGTLVHALLHHCPLSVIGGVERPGIVHRLDKDTSGVMVVAKNDAAHRSLAAQFQNRAVEKIYLALVWGSVKQDAGAIDAPLGRDSRQRIRISTRTRRPREALTRFEVLERFPGGPGRSAFTWLEVKPKTGRTHQIRVHLKTLGHPIAGDTAYGGAGWRRLTDTGRRAALQELDRLALHASRLAFDHPVTGRRERFEAPLPVELGRLLDRLRASGG